MVIPPLSQSINGIQRLSSGSDSVVKSTIHLDTTSHMAHREGNAAAFGMCAGLAFPTVTQLKGGR